MKKDLIIGCSTGYKWDTIKYWVNSINQSGFTGDRVMIMMNADKETVQKVTDTGFTVIGFKQDEQGNLVYQSNIMVHLCTTYFQRRTSTVDVDPYVSQCA